MLDQFRKVQKDPATHFPSPPLLHHRSPPPTVSRCETGLIFFVSSRRIQKWPQLVKPSPVERETEERRSGSADSVFLFRPRRRLKPVWIASPGRGELGCSLISLNGQLRKENQREQERTVPNGSSISGHGGDGRWCLWLRLKEPSTTVVSNAQIDQDWVRIEAPKLLAFPAGSAFFGVSGHERRQVWYQTSSLIVIMPLIFHFG